MTVKESRSGIYLLPNLLTTASLFAAFYSIVASLKGLYETAIIAILIGMIADTLDGRIARMTNTQTDFGAQYDSLSDMVTFGVAPPLLFYSLSLQYLGKIGWLIAFLYTAAVAIRLAKFNTLLGSDDKQYFRGLPCPPAAAVVCAFTWFCIQYQITHFVPMITAMIAVVLAALMVSNIPYYSFKDIDFKSKVPFLYLLLMVIVFVAVAANPVLVLFSCSILYAVSGPVHCLLRRRSS